MTELPFELLHEIFSLAIEEDSDTISQISSVCLAWRNVSFASPNLWHHLFLDGTKHELPKLRNKAGLWIARSDPVLLNITLYYDRRPDILLPLMSYVLPVEARWGEVTYWGEDPETFVSSEYAPGDSARLGSVDIMFTRLNFESAVTRLAWNPTKGRLAELSIPLRSLSFDLRYISPYMGVTRLVLSSGTKEYTVSASCQDVVGLLAAFPKLKYFRMWNHSRIPQIYPCDCHMTLKLPDLATFSSERATGFTCILSHLLLPQLADVVVEGWYPGWNLEQSKLYNQDVSPHGKPTLEQCFGSSSSGGPSTITSLKFLCIKATDQDYIWIFHHLLSLQTLEFRCSRITDSTIALMQPHGKRRVLPKLSKLILVNCNLISGDVLVETIRSRVEGKCHHQRLTLLCVSRCRGILEEHRVALLDLLDENLEWYTDNGV